MLCRARLFLKSSKGRAFHARFFIPIFSIFAKPKHALPLSNRQFAVLFILCEMMSDIKLCAHKAIAVDVNVQRVAIFSSKNGP